MVLATWGTSKWCWLFNTTEDWYRIHRLQPSCHRGFAYAVDDVAVLAAGEDPMGHIRDQLADAINKLNSTLFVLFETLTGLFGSALNQLIALDLAVSCIFWCYC